MYSRGHLIVNSGLISGRFLLCSMLIWNEAGLDLREMFLPGE